MNQLIQKAKNGRLPWKASDNFAFHFSTKGPKLVGIECMFEGARA